MTCIKTTKSCTTAWLWADDNFITNFLKATAFLLKVSGLINKLIQYLKVWSLARYKQYHNLIFRGCLKWKTVTFFLARFLSG